MTRSTNPLIIIIIIIIIAYGSARRASYQLTLHPVKNHALRLRLGAHYRTFTASSLCVLANEPPISSLHTS